MKHLSDIAKTVAAVLIFAPAYLVFAILFFIAGLIIGLFVLGLFIVELISGH